MQCKHFSYKRYKFAIQGNKISPLICSSVTVWRGHKNVVKIIRVELCDKYVTGTKEILINVSLWQAIER